MYRGAHSECGVLKDRALNRERLPMTLTQIAAGSAILAVLTVQAVSAQPGPAPPPPDQPSSTQSAPPPPPDQPPPPPAAQSTPDQPGPPPGAPPPGAPPGPPPQASGPPPGGPPAAVNTNVNLRQGPGTNYPIVITIPAGAPVAVTGCSGAWCQVTFQGQSGYIIATSLGAPPPLRPYPPGYPPPPPPLYPPPYYGPPPYGYYGPGPYWRHRGYYGGWHRHW